MAQAATYEVMYDCGSRSHDITEVYSSTQSRRCRSTKESRQARGLEPITRPFSQQDVDRELWDLLDLATDDELEAVHDILFGKPLPAFHSLAPILSSNEYTQQSIRCMSSSKGLGTCNVHVSLYDVFACCEQVRAHSAR